MLRKSDLETGIEISGKVLLLLHTDGPLFQVKEGFGEFGLFRLLAGIGKKYGSSASISHLHIASLNMRAYLSSLRTPIVSKDRPRKQSAAVGT
jgi:hypothetical protein